MANDYVESGYVEDGYIVASGTVGSYLFDGDSKRITLIGITVLNLIDLHSRWKDWVGLGYANFAQAFLTVGGDIPAIPLYLFLLNGWRIVPQAADHTLSVMNGIFEVDGGGDPFVDPVGDFAIRINRETPGIAIGYSTGGGTGVTAAEVWEYATRTLTSAQPSAADIAAAILAAAQIAPIHADTRKMNGATVAGDGSAGNLWRGS